MRALAIVAVLLGPLAIPLACAGKVESRPTDAGPDATSTASPEACQACVDVTCKPTWDACLADTTCTAQTDCIAACRDAACEAKCIARFPSKNADATLACWRGPCAKSCTR